MLESNFMDEIDCSKFFDQIDDLIEFPPEIESGGVNIETSCDAEGIPSMWNGALPEKTDPFSYGCRGTAPDDLSAELFVPYEDIVQLEWLSTFVEESFSGGGGMTIGKEDSCITAGLSQKLFQSRSPVSSSSSSSFSCGETMPHYPNHRCTQRARTKRPRPTTFNPRAAIQLISPSSSSIELPPVKKLVMKPKQEKKIKCTLPPKPTDKHQNSPPLPVRKCLHCEITKTPQWRTGPMGPKTLCNACGVRHKSGRLFPEYRPAASPTFVPFLHSNSHNKVMAMRSNDIPERVATTKTTTTPVAPKLELVPNCLS